jgi:hypothetical protein
MSPKLVKISPGVSAHGDHTDRAPGAVHQLDPVGQDVLDPVPVDGVRVTPAHLHELEVVITGEVLDDAQQASGGDRVPVLVDEPHRILDSATAWTSSS